MNCVLVRTALSLVAMPGRSVVAIPFRALVVTPVKPLVDSRAICAVLMLVLRAATWAEVNAPSAALDRLARFAVAAAAMAPSALVVRPVTCAVPIRPQLSGGELGGHCGQRGGGQGVDLGADQGLHLRVEMAPNCALVRAAISLVLMLAMSVVLKLFSEAVDTPLKPLVDSAEICVVLMLVPRR